MGSCRESVTILFTSVVHSANMTARDSPGQNVDNHPIMIFVTAARNGNADVRDWPTCCAVSNEYSCDSQKGFNTEGNVFLLPDHESLLTMKVDIVTRILFSRSAVSICTLRV